jgi:hypothetical protein
LGNKFDSSGERDPRDSHNRVDLVSLSLLALIMRSGSISKDAELAQSGRRRGQ